MFFQWKYPTFVVVLSCVCWVLSVITQPKINTDDSLSSVVPIAQNHIIEKNITENIENVISHNDNLVTIAPSLEFQGMIKAGTRIPMVLLTKIDSRFSSPVCFQSQRDIHDLYHKHKVLPRGLRFCGHYHLEGSRVLLTLNKLTMPDGKDILFDQGQVTSKEGVLGLSVHQVKGFFERVEGYLLKSLQVILIQKVPDLFLSRQDWGLIEGSSKDIYLLPGFEFYMLIPEDFYW